VTIGTHLSWRRDALVSAVRQAARALPGVEFHLSDGDRNSTRHDREANFHRLGFVSYARDLPGYSLVVHHGGAGALSHTLAHGLPALIIPADYDQFDNAARLEWAGAGLRVHRLRELAGLVDRVLGDKQMRARCRDLQRRVVAGAAEELVAARVAAALGLAK
jgi:UDP:flavonoid glycosyltransferase YjiC (YdhE family)